MLRQKKHKKRETTPYKQIKVLYANVQSLKNKIPELGALLDANEADVACLQESWTLQRDENATICPTNYEIVSRVDKNTKSGIGGGVIIMKRQGLTMEEVERVDKSYFQANSCVLTVEGLKST